MAHYPKTTVNGVLTFGKLITWYRVVQDDNAHRKIYKQLGMNIKDLRSQNYSGIDHTYIYLKPYSSIDGVVTQNDIRNYINEYTPLIYPNSKDPFNQDPLADTNLNPDPYKGTADQYWDKDGWITVVLTYTPTTVDMIDNAITDSQILQKARNISPSEIFYDPKENNRITGLAMMDLNSNAVFQTQLRIMSKSVIDKPVSIRNLNISGNRNIRYVQSAYIEMKYRRVVDISVGTTVVPSVQTYLTGIENTVEALKASLASGSILSKLSARTASSSVNQQLIIMANWIAPAEDDEMTLTQDPEDVNAYYPRNTESSIKVDGLADLPPKKFQKEFLKLVTFDYKVKKKKGHWYDAVVSIVIAVVSIVVAAVLASTGNFAGAALALSLGALSEGVWAMYLVKNGGGSGAIRTTMGISEILGIAALVTGITALYQQWQQKALLESTKKAAEKAVIKAVESGAEQSVIDASANTFIQAYEADAATQSISSLIGESIASGASAGQKLGLIDGDLASTIGTVSGIASGGYEFLSSTSAASVTLPTIDDISNSISSGVTKFMSKPTSEIMNTVINWTNSAFNAYVSYIAPPNEGLADKQAELERLQTEVDSTSPDNVDNTWTAYTDAYGSIFEVGDYYDKTYIMLTQGLNRTMMNQCYDSGYKV